MNANRIARFERSAAECADMAAKTRDQRAKAVLATAASVWRSLARLRNHQGQSKEAADLIDQLDTTIIDRESRAITNEE
jgi:hypothetical protein